MATMAQRPQRPPDRRSAAGDDALSGKGESSSSEGRESPISPLISPDCVSAAPSFTFSGEAVGRPQKRPSSRQRQRADGGVGPNTGGGRPPRPSPSPPPPPSIARKVTTEMTEIEMDVAPSSAATSTDAVAAEEAVAAALSGYTERVAAASERVSTRRGRVSSSSRGRAAPPPPPDGSPSSGRDVFGSLYGLSPPTSPQEKLRRPVPLDRRSLPNPAAVLSEPSAAVAAGGRSASARKRTEGATSERFKPVAAHEGSARSRSLAIGPPDELSQPVPLTRRSGSFLNREAVALGEPVPLTRKTSSSNEKRGGSIYRRTSSKKMEFGHLDKQTGLPGDGAPPRSASVRMSGMGLAGTRGSKKDMGDHSSFLSKSLARTASLRAAGRTGTSARSSSNSASGFARSSNAASESKVPTPSLEPSGDSPPFSRSLKDRKSLSTNSRGLEPPGDDQTEPRAAGAVDSASAALAAATTSLSPIVVSPEMLTRRDHGASSTSGAAMGMKKDRLLFDPLSDGPLVQSRSSGLRPRSDDDDDIDDGDFSLAASLTANNLHSSSPDAGEASPAPCHDDDESTHRDRDQRGRSRRGRARPSSVPNAVRRRHLCAEEKSRSISAQKSREESQLGPTRARILQRARGERRQGRRSKRGDKGGMEENQQKTSGVPERFEAYLPTFDRLSSPYMLYQAKKQLLSTHSSHANPNKLLIHPLFDPTTGLIVAYEGSYTYPKNVGTFTGQFSATSFLPEGMGTFLFEDGTEFHAAEWRGGGVPGGEGTVKFADGTVYVGIWTCQGSANEAHSMGDDAVIEEGAAPRPQLGFHVSEVTRVDKVFRSFSAMNHSAAAPMLRQPSRSPTRDAGYALSPSPSRIIRRVGEFDDDDGDSSLTDGGGPKSYLPQGLRVRGSPGASPTRTTPRHRNSKKKGTPRTGEGAAEMLLASASKSSSASEEGSRGSSRSSGGSEVKGLRGPTVLFGGDTSPSPSGERSSSASISRDGRTWSPSGRWKDSEPSGADMGAAEAAAAMALSQSGSGGTGSGARKPTAAAQPEARSQRHAKEETPKGAPGPTIDPTAPPPSRRHVKKTPDGRIVARNDGESDENLDSARTPCHLPPLAPYSSSYYCIFRNLRSPYHRHRNRDKGRGGKKSMRNYSKLGSSKRRRRDELSGMVVGEDVECDNTSWSSKESLTSRKENSSAVEGNYYGQWENGVPHGVGAFQFPDGATYTGNFHSGYPHGDGKFTFGPPTQPSASSSSPAAAGAASFTGTWSQGLPHGLGVYVWPDGSKYRGEFFKGSIEGQGKVKFVTGDVYEGGFRGDAVAQITAGRKPSSSSVTSSGPAAAAAASRGPANGSVYHGEGVYKWSDGVVDVCTYRSGYAAGRGKRWNASRTRAVPLKNGRTEAEAAGPSVRDLIEAVTGGLLEQSRKRAGKDGGGTSGTAGRSGSETPGPQCLCEVEDQEALDQMDFFLPAAGVGCGCGRRKQPESKPKNAYSKTPGYENHLSTLLRPWQVAFLSSASVVTADQLVRANDRSAENLAAAMDSWRRERGMELRGLVANAIALRIWAMMAKNAIGGTPASAGSSGGGEPTNKSSVSTARRAKKTPGSTRRRLSDDFRSPTENATAPRAQWRGEGASESSPAFAGARKSMLASPDAETVSAEAIAVAVAAAVPPAAERADKGPPDLWSAAILLQRFLRGNAARWNAQSRRASVSTIQRVYRGSAIRSSFALVIAAVVAIQAIARMSSHRFVYLCQREAAIRIQGFYLRRREGLLVARMQEMEAAAIVIQAFYAHRLVTRMDKMEAAAVVLQTNARGQASRSMLFQILSAVCIIQAWYRGTAFRTAHHSERSAAITIQQRWREAMLRQPATRIQAQWRRHVAQSAYRVQRAAAAARANALNRILTAVIVIQTTYRRHLARSASERRRSAALRIQPVARGHIGRLHVRSLHARATIIQRQWKAKLERAAREDALRRVAGAIVAIQACSRRHLRSSAYSAAKSSAVHVQRVYRGRVARRTYVGLLARCVAVQSTVRMYACRRDYLHCLAEDRRLVSATVMQSCVRMWMRRREYLERRSAARRVQCFYRRRMALRRLSEAEMESAATAIQARARGWTGRLDLRSAVRKVATLQAWSRGARVRRTFMEKRSAATTVQSGARMAIAARRYWLALRAAAKLQATWRRQMALSKYADCQSSAVLLQSMARRGICRSKFVNHLALVRACVLLQGASRGGKVRDQRRSEDRSAVKVQIVWRVSKARSKFRANMQCVVKIQALARMVLEKEKLALSRRSCVLLQSLARGGKVRDQRRSEDRSAAKVQILWRISRAVSKFRANVQCVVKIQSLARMVLEKERLASFRRSCVMLQSLARGGNVRDHVRLENGSATKVQSVWRMNRAQTQSRADVRCVVTIQSLARMVLEKEKLASSRRSFVMLQSLARGGKVRDHARLENRSATKAQNVWRTKRAQTQFRADVRCVVTIQALVRMVLEKDRLASFRRSCVVLQSLARGGKVRDHVRLKNRSAAEVQSVWRMTNARNQLKAGVKCVVTIQSLARKVLEKERLASSLRAAAAIQSVARGRAARRRARFLNANTTLLQSQWRGKRCRDRRRADLRSVVVIQAAYRRHRIAERYIACRSGAVSLQSRTRGASVRAELSARHSSAIQIQRIWRGCVAVWDYHEEQERVAGEDLRSEEVRRVEEAKRAEEEFLAEEERRAEEARAEAIASRMSESKFARAFRFGQRAREMSLSEASLGGGDSSAHELSSSQSEEKKIEEAAAALSGAVEKAPRTPPTKPPPLSSRSVSEPVSPSRPSKLNRSSTSAFPSRSSSTCLDEVAQEIMASGPILFQTPAKVARQSSSTSANAAGNNPGSAIKKSLADRGKWHASYWAQYGPTTLLIFSSKADFEEWKGDTAASRRLRNFLVQLTIDFGNDRLIYKASECEGRSHGRRRKKRVTYEFEIYLLLEWGGTRTVSFFASEAIEEVEFLQSVIQNCSFMSQIQRG